MAKVATLHRPLHLPAPRSPAGGAGTGPPGPTGPQAPPGAPAPPGPQATPGPTGPTGATGPQGATGPAGPTGATGPQGPAGESSNFLEYRFPTGVVAPPASGNVQLNNLTASAATL